MGNKENLSMGVSKVKFFVEKVLVYSESPSSQNTDTLMEDQKDLFLPGPCDKLSSLLKISGYKF